MAHYFATTSPDGRFVFDRVIPGHGRVGLMLMPTVFGGAMAMDSSCMVTADFNSGQTLQIGLEKP